MSIIEKSCVGCGIVFACLDIGDTLYCSNTCSESHSLFDDQDTTVQVKKCELVIGQESFAI